MAWFLLTLLSLSALVCSCLAAEYGWKPQKEYSFAVQGQDLVGLPQLKQQYAGFRFNGEMRVQSHSPRVLLVKLLNMNYTKIHEELKEGWWTGPTSASRNKTTKNLPVTTSTVVVKLTRSKSPELVVQVGLEDWQVNLIKGLVGRVLAYPGETSPTAPNSNRFSHSPEKDMFSAIEDSVVGRCEVMYELSKLPRSPAVQQDKLCGREQLWEITKTRNYSNCELLSEDHGHLPAQDCTPGGANCGSFWTRASVTQMIGCGEKNSFVLLSSVTSSVMNAQLHLQNNSQASVTSNVNITLLSVLDLTRKFNAPENKQTLSSLLYSYSATPKDNGSVSQEDNATNESKSAEGGASGASDSDAQPTNRNNKESRTDRTWNSRRRIKREPKKKYLRKYDTNTSNNDENQNSYENNNRYNNGANDNGKNESDKSYGNNENTNSHENGNNYLSNENSAENENPNSFNNKNNKGTRKSWQKSSEDSSNGNTNNNENPNIFNNKRAGGKRKSWNRSPENESNENSASDENPNSFNNRNSKNKPNSWNRSPENDSNENPASDENPNSFNNKKSKNKPKSWQHSSEETYDQPSEEMQQEDYWKIPAKDQKKNPPHQPFNMFSLAHRTTYDVSCMNPKLRQVIADIASDLEETNILPEKKTMEKLSHAVDICRVLPLDQLSSVGEEVFEVHSSAPNDMKNNERKVFRDVVTMCGTHPALQVIKGWVERKQVEGEEAAQMIASIPSHALSPNKYFVQDFFEMVQHINGKDDTQLTTTAVLALSNLVRDACVNQRARQHHFSSIVMPVCDKGTVSHITDWLAHQVSPQNRLARVYIEALGNVGSPDVIPLLKDVALDPKFSSYLQTSAVFSMRYQMLRKNPEMIPLLMSLYHNYTLPAGTRIAAAAMLFYTDPGVAVWQRLAFSTWYDPNPSVAQFVASTLRSMATSKDSVYAHMTKSAALVQPLARPAQISIHQPYNHITSWFSSDLEKLILEQLEWMQFFDFTNIYYRHSSRFSGFSRINVEASLGASNLDGLWTAFKEMIISSSNGHSSGPNKNMSRTFTKIQEALGLSYHSMPQMQADIHLRINHMMERMMVVNKDTFKSWAKAGRRIVDETLKEGKSLSFQKTDMNSFHISTTTELGFPVEFSVRTPWMISAKADLNVTDQGLIIGGSFMYSSQLLSSVSVMSAWDNTAHSAGAYGTNFVQLPPLRLITSLDTAMSALKVTTVYVDQHRLLYFSMQPFTSQRKLKIHQSVLLSPDTIPIKIGEPIQVPISWMNRYLNTVYSSEEPQHFNPMDFIQQARLVVGFPMLMSDVEPRSFETVMNPLHPVIMNFSLSMASKSMGLQQLESPRDTVLGEIYNALKKTHRTVHNVHTTTMRPQNESMEANSTSTERPRLSPEGAEGTTTPKPDNTTTPSQAKDSKHSSDKEKDIMDEPESVEGYQVYATTYTSAGGSFNASQVNPFGNSVNGSTESYLLEQSLSNIHSGNAVVLGFNMWSTHPEQPTKVSAYTAYSTTYSRRASRLGFFWKNDMKQVLTTVIYEAPVDLAVDLKRRVAEDLQHNLFIDYVHHNTSGGPMKVFLQANFGMSKATLAQLKASSHLEVCSQGDSRQPDAALNKECQQSQGLAREIGFGEITAYYNDDAKSLENTVQLYTNGAKFMLPRTHGKPGKGSNTMYMMFDVNQRTKSADIQITAPRSSLDIRRLPLSWLPMPLVAEWALQSHSAEEFCGISTQRVNTFDGAHFQYKMKDGWHLVSRDCTGRYGFSVLAQPRNNNSLAIEVNIDDRYTITVEEGPKVYVNNKLQPLDVTHPLLRLTNRKGDVLAHTVFTPDSSVHIDLPSHKLDLVYATTSFVIRAGEGLQGRLCGLCGRYARTSTEQFITAHGSPATSPAEFAASYFIKGLHSEDKNTRNQN